MLRKAIVLFVTCFVASIGMAKADHQNLNPLESSLLSVLCVLGVEHAFSSDVYKPEELLVNELKLAALQKEGKIKVSGPVAKIKKRYDGKIQIEWKVPDSESKLLVAIVPPILNAESEMSELSAGDELSLTCSNCKKESKRFVLSGCSSRNMLLESMKFQTILRIQDGLELEGPFKKMVELAVRMSTILSADTKHACSNEESCKTWIFLNVDSVVDSMKKDLTLVQQRAFDKRCQELGID